MAVENEPVYTSSIVGGVATGTSFLILQEPIKDILLEIGASERLATALVTIVMFLLPIGVGFLSAWWARKRTVTLATANDRIQMAFELHPSSPPQAVKDLMVTKQESTAPPDGARKGINNDIR